MNTVGEETTPWSAPDAPPRTGGDAAPAGDSGAASGAGTGPRSHAAAGVAVARGDAPWPHGDTGRDLGERNPLARLEPVGPGGVIDGGFDLLRVGFAPLVGLAAALLLPLQLLELVVNLQLGVFDSMPVGADTAFSGAMSAMSVLSGSAGPFSWVAAALRVIVLSFLGVVAGNMVRELMAGRMPRSSTLWRMALSRWWVAALIPLLAAPLKAIGTCGAYVGFFFVDALLMCASVAAGAERLGPLRALGRSREVSQPRYGAALAIAVGGFLISLILQVALFAGPLALVALFNPPEAVFVVVQQVAGLVLLITQPLTACIAARSWVEFRCSTEGLDLARRRELLELDPAA